MFNGTEPTQVSQNQEDNPTSSGIIVNPVGNFKPGDFVIVNYLDLKFPGVVEEINDKEAFLSAMTPKKIVGMMLFGTNLRI
ncbi:hypothetical protein JTB14_015167 [Gonioctena quinquepunctata]|nr:hypothetical protein JTB14_015167 [Gonioctena quinquepunctata]